MSKNTPDSTQVSDGTFAVVGNYIGFKSDIEQYAKVISVKRYSGGRFDTADRIVVEAPAGGFSGEYIRGLREHELYSEDCWGGLTVEQFTALTAPKATRKPSTKKATTVKASTSTQPVDKNDRVNTLARALDSKGSLTAEQAADVLKLQGQFRKQAAVAALTQLVKKGYAIKRTIKGTTTYTSK